MSVFAAERYGSRECVGRELRQFLGGIAHSLKKLRDNRAGVAAGPVEQVVGDTDEQFAEVRVRRGLERPQRRSQ